MISKYFKMFLVAASSLTLFTSCSKDDPEPGADVVNFSPLTPNSYWTYRNSSGSTFTLTATNRDTVALGKSYRVLTNSAGANFYLGKTGSEYYRFGVFPQLGSTPLEELYLKDGEAVNGTWTTTPTIALPAPLGNIQASLKYTIKEKSISRTVGSKTFTNVTHVRLDISAMGIQAGSGEFYYAEGVGLIENEINITFPSAYTQSQTLLDYSIK